MFDLSNIDLLDWGKETDYHHQGRLQNQPLFQHKEKDKGTICLEKSHDERRRVDFTKKVIIFREINFLSTRITVGKIPQQSHLRWFVLVSIQRICCFPFQGKNCEIKCPPLLEHSDHA